MKVVPVTVGPVRGSGFLSLNSCVSTVSKNISESSIAGFNSTAHVSLTSDPIIRIDLAFSLLLVNEI